MTGEERLAALPWLCLLFTLVKGTLYPTENCVDCFQGHTQNSDCSSEDLSSQCGSEILKRCSGLSALFLTKYYDGTDLCYSFHLVPTSWYMAKDKCEDLGGRLLKMEDLQLKHLHATYWFYNGSIVTKSELYNTVAWTGARESASGQFRWTDGTPVVLQNCETINSVVSFFKGLFSQQVLCLVLFYSWQKKDCNTKYPFICEHEATVPSTQIKALAKTMSGTSTPNMSVTLPPTSFGKQIPNMSVTSPPTMSGAPISKEAEASAGGSTTSIGDRMQCVFVGVKAVAGYFNPRLTAKPNDEKKAKGIKECLRVCKEDEKCTLVNFSAPDYCAIYWNAALAQRLGAEHSKGWSVWMLQQRP